jgi:nitrite reductase/ring-hydroxylating ferredoxin subunit
MAELTDGQLGSVAVDGERICLGRIGDRIYAIGSLCTHSFGRLEYGEIIPESFEVECPIHGGRFDLRTGAPTMYPCVDPVASYRVRVDAGEIYVLPVPSSHPPTT